MAYANSADHDPTAVEKVCHSTKGFNITKTRLYNFDTLKPNFYTDKIEFAGVHIIFLISAMKHRLWVPVRNVSQRGF